MGKKLPDGTNKCDSWDIERLDRDGEEGATGMKTSRGRHEASQRQEGRRAQSPKATAACLSQDSEQDRTVKDQREGTEGSRRSGLEDS